MVASRRRASFADEESSADANDAFALDHRCFRKSLRGGRALLAWEGAVPQVARLAAAARGNFRRIQSTTSWISADSEPRTTLERYAQEVFWFHVQRLGWSREAVLRLSGRGAAGAEFWVQRKSPEPSVARRSIDWHFDKDEGLLEDHGIMVFPVIASVTYLTDGGAPLVVLTRPTLTTGPDGTMGLEPIEHSSADAFAVFPAKGRHVAFRGDYLHGCPAEVEHLRAERLSVLVNVWLHHQPLDLRGSGPCGAVSRRRTHGNVRSFEPGASVPVARCRLSGRDNGGDDTEVRAFTFGPWKLSGLRLPHGLGYQPPAGVWVVRQPPGQLALALRSAERARRAPLKRPAAGSRASTKRPAAAVERQTKRPRVAP